MEDRQIKMVSERAIYTFIVSIFIIILSSLIYFLVKALYVLGLLALIGSFFLAITSVNRLLSPIRNVKGSLLLALLFYSIVVFFAILHLYFFVYALYPESIRDFSSLLKLAIYIFALIAVIACVYTLFYVGYSTVKGKIIIPSLSREEKPIFISKENRPDPEGMRVWVRHFARRMALVIVCCWLVLLTTLLYFPISNPPEYRLGLIVLFGIALAILTFSPLIFLYYTLPRWYREANFLRDVVFTGRSIKILISPPSEEVSKVLWDIKLDKIKECKANHREGYLELVMDRFSLRLFLEDSDMDELVRLVEKYKDSTL